MTPVFRSYEKLGSEFSKKIYGAKNTISRLTSHVSRLTSYVLRLDFAHTATTSYRTCFRHLHVFRLFQQCYKIH